MDIEDWCHQNGLSAATARQLRRDGFITAEDLRDVTDDDVRVTFQKLGKLPLQQCVALREALRDFHRGKARRRHRSGISIAEWSMSNDLDAETAKILEKEGFTTDDDMKYVTAHDVKTTFQKKGLLPLQQCIALRKALEGNNISHQYSAPGMDDDFTDVHATDRQNGKAQRTIVAPSSVDKNSRLLSSPPRPRIPRTRHTGVDGSHSTKVTEKEDERGQDFRITSFRPSDSDRTQYSGHRVSNPDGRHHGKGADYRMVVVGAEGSGKSRTVQSILGQQDDTIQGLQGETASGRIRRGRLLGHSVQILDTSGWLGTSRRPSDTAAMISTDLQQLHPGPHAVLYTIDVSSRYTKEQSILYQQLQAIFGHRLQPYLILVFTHGDSLRGTGKGLEDMLHTAPSALRELLNECPGRCVLFDNKHVQQDQVHELFNLLEEVTSQNLPTPFLSTAEGPEAAEEIAKRLSEVEEALMEQSSFIQSRRQQQKESGKQVKRSKKVLEKRASQGSREQTQLLLQMRDLEKSLQHHSLRQQTFYANADG